MPKLSIIVPVYNVEKYLPKCIDSILAQTMSDFELLLIDDGSPDRCGKICDEYAEKDPRIKVIHQVNKGVSAARNAGLVLAKGEYIGFVDPDDWIEPSMYKLLIDAIQNYKADISVCGVNHYQYPNKLEYNSLNNKGCYTNEQMFLALFGKPSSIWGSVCNKIFIRKNIRGIFFSETTCYSEDWVFLVDVLKNSNKIIKIDNLLYNVLERDDSATRSNTIIKYRVIKSWDTVLSHAEYCTSSSMTIIYDKFLDTCIRMINSIKKESNGNQMLILRIRVYIIKKIITAKYKKCLSPESFHRYLVEVLKL